MALGVALKDRVIELLFVCVNLYQNACTLVY